MPRWRRVAGRVVAVGGWLSLAVAIGVWAALRLADEWAPATQAMFTPLWLLAAPPALLLPAAVFRPRALWTLLPSLFLILGPITALSAPLLGQLGDNPPAKVHLRVLTCNLHYKRIPAGPLDRLIEDIDPDVVLLQEGHSAAMKGLLAKPEWHTRQFEGLQLASHYPIRRAELLGDHSTCERGLVARYELETPGGVVTVFNLHLASPREGLLETVKERGDLDGIAANSALRWTQSRYIAGEVGSVSGPVFLAGDFNTPPQSAIFRDVWAGYTDAFAAAGWGWGPTFISRLSVVRIDHILVVGGGRVTQCWVGPDIGSPHRPVIANVAW